MYDTNRLNGRTAFLPSSDGSFMTASEVAVDGASAAV
jgi:hypothetical protein